ncbi:MAG: hypothetical protein KGI29_08980 [Pseudomonadota bacterium]|nr:hypothetical protein [Pseudomonadota bacterium]
MKMVEFTRDMRPHRAGDKRVVPDAVAARLITAGDAKHYFSVFDESAQAPPAPGKPHKTRKRK